jgi:hypothetical protein
MDRFEYVMVLISIILGLGIAHILMGLGGVIDRLTGRGEPIRLGLAHAGWLGMVFAWMILFWWWEYRFSELDPEWTVALYFFLVAYAVTLFLLGVTLVPRDWDGVTDLDAFFVRRRAWFYSFLLLANGLDVIDALLKGGWGYVRALGPVSYVQWVVVLPVCIVGMRTTTVRWHRIMAILFCLWQVWTGFEVLGVLGF